jgi:rare lipoprotein A
MLNFLVYFIFLLQVLFNKSADPHTNTAETLKSNGKASFYHDKFQGCVTSNGEIYDKDDFTAAHRTLPFNTIVHVLNKKNGKSVIVRINDRGPFVKSRIIDLSRSAAEKIEMVPFGIVPVKISQMTLLDNLPLADSSFAENEIWNVFGTKTNLNKSSVVVWITENWKHAFYVASKISLDYKLDEIVIRISGTNQQRTYDLIATGLESEMTGDSLAQVFKKHGYKRAHTLTSQK